MHLAANGVRNASTVEINGVNEASHLFYSSWARKIQDLLYFLLRWSHTLSVDGVAQVGYFFTEEFAFVEVDL